MCMGARRMQRIRCLLLEPSVIEADAHLNANFAATAKHQSHEGVLFGVRATGQFPVGQLGRGVRYSVMSRVSCMESRRFRTAARSPDISAASSSRRFGSSVPHWSSPSACSLAAAQEPPAVSRR